MENRQELLSLINQRIEHVTDLIKEANADALIIFNQANYRYLTNFTGEEAQLILTASGERYFYQILVLLDRLKHKHLAKWML